MMEQCEKRNPLVRDGTSQRKRLLDALRPDYFRVDERSLDELLMVASRYAGKLQYYSSDNRPYGDWRAFIEYDISAIIAVIANRDISEIRFAREHLEQLLEWESLTSDDLGGILSREFSLLFSLCAELDGWYRRAVQGLSLEKELNRLITSQLAETMSSAIGYYKCAEDSDFTGPVTDILFPLEDEMVVPAAEALQHDFHPIWFVDEGDADSWQTYLAGITQDCTLFEPADGGPYIRYYNGAERLLSLVDIVYNAHAQVIHNAPDYLDESLTAWPKHEPHMVLFLAFLQLFRYAQEHLNTLTGRHLDFYYKEVLRLSRTEAVPDSVHVIFELAKQVDSHLIKAGTPLQAGKDTAGKQLDYTTDRDIVVNEATVEELKSLHIDKTDNSRIYAAPVANSADGEGTEFEKPVAKWDTFGRSQRNPSGSGFLSREERTMTFASAGFAVATPGLLLQQGTRKVFLKFTASSAPFEGLSREQLTVEYTGEEGWFGIENSDIHFENNDKTLRIDLHPESPAVVPYDKSVHGGNYATDLPLLKVTMTNAPDLGAPYAYGQIRDRTFTGLSVQVTVDDLTDLVLQNDYGILDATKPFQPFGPQPRVGSRLYIGSREVMQKRLSQLKLKFRWQGVPESNLATHYQNLDDSITNSSFKVKYDMLLDRNWVSLTSGENLFQSADATKEQTNTIDSTDFSGLSEFESEVIQEELQEYNHETDRGFLRVTLTDPSVAFGHGIFRETYTKTVLKYAKEGVGFSKIPNEPYTPVIEQLRLSYKATDTLHLRTDQTGSREDPVFFHVTPFGTRVIQSGEESSLHLMPQFRYPISGSPTHNQGELYIGIMDLNPRQNLSLLFQVAEGSVDPELPVQAVYWSFLSDNQWIPFEPAQILSDSTSGLLTSGILRLDIPDDATDDNTLLSGGLHWLRASVPEHSAAVCDMIAIHTQAVRATFADRNNDPAHLATDLPADSITKTDPKDPDIKSVSQPYSSFGGKMQEQETAFYTRVSERLRHKNRGITIWDYERLVLEAFPSVYKVKCINHSTYNYTGDGLTIPGSEFAPGYVTLIVIPNLQNKNAVNPLEPRASLGTLTEISDTIRQHISPFAAERIRVINPLYEKIQVDFKVTFRTGYDRGYYETQLNEDIIGFLSPWISGESRDILFGGQIHKSVILNFVEELDYVDYVREFRMNQFIPMPTTEELRIDINEAVASSARTVFVSHDQHLIGE